MFLFNCVLYKQQDAARRSRAKIPMARPNEPDTPTKVQLGIYRTQIHPVIFLVGTVKGGFILSWYGNKIC